MDNLQILGNSGLFKYRPWSAGYIYLASQDALEVMRVTHLLSHSLTESLSHWVSVSIDSTDVTLVSEDTYLKIHWCDPNDFDDPDDGWKLSGDESYLVMNNT